MKIHKYFPLSLLLFLVAACGTGEENSSGNTASGDEYSVSNTEASTKEGDFIYRLSSEKEEYASGGPIEVFAELEYVGGEEIIEISHAGSPFYFPMAEKTRGYQLDYPMVDPLLMTTLTKGEPLREYYNGSGGYSDQEDAAYIEFMQQLMNNEFPKGYYIVQGYADFYTETPDGIKTDYELNAEVDFKVMEK